jgi:hypothetical protein
LLATDLNKITAKDLEANNIIKIKDLYNMNKIQNKKCLNVKCNSPNCKLEIEKLNKRVIYLTEILLKSQEKLDIYYFFYCFYLNYLHEFNFIRLKTQNSNTKLSKNLRMHSKSYQDFSYFQTKDNSESSCLLSKEESDLLKNRSDIDLNEFKSAKSSRCCKITNDLENSSFNGVGYLTFPNRNSNIIRLTREDSDLITEFNKKRLERETSL